MYSRGTPYGPEPYLAVYDSPAAMATAAAAATPKNYETASTEWAGGTLEDATRHATTGAPELVAAARALMHELRDIRPPTPRPTWVHAVAGSRPDVPATIAGLPLAMWQRDWTLSTLAPIRVVLDIGAMSTIPAKHVQARGMAAVALAAILGTHRQTELLAVQSSATPAGIPRLIAYRVSHSPINLAHALGATSSPTKRHLMHRLILGTTDCGRGIPCPLFRQIPAYRTMMRQVMRLSPQDILLDHLMESSTTSLACTNPAAFVRQILSGIPD